MTDFVPGKQPDVCPLQQTRDLLANVDPDSPQVRDLIATLVRRHVALTSTLVVFEDLTPGRQRLDAAQRALLNESALGNYDAIHRLIDGTPGRGDNPQSFTKMMRLEHLFVEAGGLLLAGTDPTGAGGALPGFASIRQIQLLVEAGFSFEQAVRIGTLNGARLPWPRPRGGLARRGQARRPDPRRRRPGPRPGGARPDPDGVQGGRRL